MGGRITETGRAAGPTTGRTARPGNGLTEIMVTARIMAVCPDLAAVAHQGTALRLTVPGTTAPTSTTPRDMAPRDTVPKDTGTLVRVRRRSGFLCSDSAAPGTAARGTASGAMAKEAVSASLGTAVTRT